MSTIKHATAIFTLLLAACGGDESTTVATAAPPPSAMTQIILKRYTSIEVNLNIIFQSETLYHDLFETRGDSTGKQTANIFNYDTISIKDKVLIDNQFDYDFNNQQWKNTTGINNESLYLTDDKWEKPQPAKTVAKGNDILLDYGNNTQYLLSGTSRDISNLAVMDVHFTKENTQSGPDYTLFKTPAPAFPSGSQAYYLGFSPLKTTYFSYYGNPTTFKTIAEWTNFYSINGTNLEEKNSQCPYQFDTSRKTIVFSNNPNTSYKCNKKEQSYEIINIKQQQLLVITATDNKSAIRKEFYAIANGNLLEGVVQEPFEINNTGSSSGLFTIEVRLNKTAINHLLKYGGLPASAQLK
ncbi:hypothetical protein [Janthinobacterium sp. B9-8]|uniref:hypothetical protein n=1 Tax=Janthinobacterium sp. B9-8 TaxID=1236179 RepID=UPI0007644D04|nr:hypothetical protein [Janthinobacterium sp. B9-8]AMC34566.1 hypothetical protein VN23_08110 [Janthinobacterium sp. B9-8]